MFGGLPARHIPPSPLRGARHYQALNHGSRGPILLLSSALCGPQRAKRRRRRPLGLAASLPPSLSQRDAGAMSFASFSYEVFGKVRRSSYEWMAVHVGAACRFFNSTERAQQKKQYNISARKKKKTIMKGARRLLSEVHAGEGHGAGPGGMGAEHGQHFYYFLWGVLLLPRSSIAAETSLLGENTPKPEPSTPLLAAAPRHRHRRGAGTACTAGQAVRAISSHYIVLCCLSLPPPAGSRGSQTERFQSNGLKTQARVAAEDGLARIKDREGGL